MERPVVAPLKPTANAIIEPMGPQSSGPRPHQISLSIRLSDGKHANREHVTELARRALAGFPAAAGDAERSLGDLTVTSKVAKTGLTKTTVVAVEGWIVWPRRPDDAPVEALRTTLAADGYRVTIVEKRECDEIGCTSLETVDWTRASLVPLGWYSNRICGRHNYRRCGGCDSVYTLTSTNSAAQAPSVHCEVCGIVLVEWGGSKIWNAELVTRGAAAG